MRRSPDDGTLVFPSASPAADGRPDLDRVMRNLGEREITSLMIEGGAMVNWAALAEGIVDKIFFYYAPKILAGTGSIPFALGAGYQRMSEAAGCSRLPCIASAKTSLWKDTCATRTRKSLATS